MGGEESGNREKTGGGNSREVLRTRDGNCERRCMKELQVVVAAWRTRDGDSGEAPRTGDGSGERRDSREWTVVVEALGTDFSSAYSSAILSDYRPVAWSV